IICLCLVLVAVTSRPASSADRTSASARQLIARGLVYLRTQQKPDGGWADGSQPPGITAIVLKAFVQSDQYDPRTDFVRRGYDRLLSYQLASGGIYKDLL